jgi:hypothetical protein
MDRKKPGLRILRISGLNFICSDDRIIFPAEHNMNKIIENPRNGPFRYIRGQIEKNRILLLAYFIFSLFFLITRLPFFIHDSIVLLSPDYQHYYMIVDQIHKGFMPIFIIRTPGYPLFLTLMFMFFKSNLAVIAVQNLLTFFCSLYFIFAVNKSVSRKFKYLPILAAIGLGAFISLSVHLCLDTALATESLYINMILIFFGSLFLAFFNTERRYWIASGFSMAMVIVIRPSGLFLIPLFLAILVFSLINAYPKKIILLFSASFTIPLLLLCLYNFFSIGNFSISTFTEHALISFTSPFLEQDPEYSPETNRAIEKSLNRLSPRKKSIIKNSWNTRQLSHILHRHYNRNRRIIFQTLKSLEDEDADNLYMKWRPVLNRIARDAIFKNPLVYMKFLYANIIQYFFKKKNIHFYHRLQERYRSVLLLKQRYLRFYKYRAPDTLRLYYKNDYIKTINPDFVKDLLKEYWKLNPLDDHQKQEVKNKTLKLRFLQRLHRDFLKAHQLLFHNKFWIFFFFTALIISSIRLITSRLRHRGTFLFFLLTAAALLHGIVISMSSFSDARLSYPLDFIYYFSLLLFPMIWMKDDDETI